VVLSKTNPAGFLGYPPGYPNPQKMANFQKINTTYTYKPN